MAHEKIKPCPLCGGFAKLEKRSKTIIGGNTAYVTYIRCTKCDCRGPRARLADYENPTDARAKAAEMWNRRDYVEPNKNKKNVVIVTLVRTRNDALPAVDSLRVYAESAEEVESVLRSRIRSYLTTIEGWKKICKGGGAYTWDSFMANPPKQILAEDYSSIYQVRGDVVLTVQADENLVPDDVEATCLVTRNTVTNRYPCTVDFTTGNVWLLENAPDLETAHEVLAETNHGFGLNRFRLSPENHYESLIPA